MPLDASDFYISELSYLCYKNPTPEIVDRLPLSGEYEILGLFFTKEKRLDFEADLGWVETIHVEEAPSPWNDMAGGWHIAFKDYLNPGEYAGYQGDAGSCRNINDSFITLILSELKKEYPLDVNPYGDKEPERMIPFKHAGFYTDRDKKSIDQFREEVDQWHFAQSQLLPDRVLILRLIAAGGTRVSASAVGDK